MSCSRKSSRSSSQSFSMSRSRSRDSIDAENPGNNLYVTGLSPRITKDDLEKHFATEGKVVDVRLVLDPWTRESRGFGFVTMARIEDADRCVKYLDRSVLEGRVITVEKARRRRGRTPTPGRYLGMRVAHGRHHSPSYSPYWRGRHSSRYSSDRDRSYSPYYRRRSYSPYDRRRSYSPCYSYYRSRSRSPFGRYSRSPVHYRGQRSRSYSCDSRTYSSGYSVSPYYCRRYCRSASRSPSASRVRRSYSRSYSPPRKSLRRSYSRSFSPPRKNSRRSYSRSFSPPRKSSGRSFSRSYSPRGSSLRRYRSKRSLPCSRSPSRGKRYLRESYSHSRSAISYSRDSRSVSSSPARAS